MAVEAAARLHDQASAWLDDIAARVENGAFGGADDHTRKFFVRSILRESAETHSRRAAELRTAPHDVQQIAAEFAYLSTRFKADVSLFERKRFVNLSHLPTKAANLNSYFSIMGRRLAAVPGPKGLELVDQSECVDLSAFELVEPPDAKYVVILDADSFLLRDYLTHMVAAMEGPGNERAAVMQTPYTSIPNTPHILERTAGATTDIYYYVTEGMSFARAGFWVGASATIRRQALLDIVTYHRERGYDFPVYIQDKTVIEDTGATIDLARKGWTVENYPARLSYSATPSDFGALVVQRRRWANGGLIILPNLLAYVFTRRPSPRNLLEAALRIHYLIMPACISISMLLMLVYPFDFKRVSSWIYVTLPPYLYLVCRDLVHTGYRRTDIFRAYALFLILLPVVLTGVKNSLLQLLFGIKAQFGRTPKIEHRTAVPLTVSAAIIALFSWSVSIFWADVTRGDGLHAIFALSNVLALGYGLVAMIGLRAIGQDFVYAVSSAAVAVWRKLVPGTTCAGARAGPGCQHAPAQGDLGRSGAATAGLGFDGQWCGISTRRECCGHAGCREWSASAHRNGFAAGKQHAEPRTTSRRLSGRVTPIGQYRSYDHDETNWCYLCADRDNAPCAVVAGGRSMRRQRARDQSGSDGQSPDVSDGRSRPVPGVSSAATP